MTKMPNPKPVTRWIKLATMVSKKTRKRVVDMMNFLLKVQKYGFICFLEKESVLLSHDTNINSTFANKGVAGVQELSLQNLNY